MLAAARELDPQLWVWESKTMARHLGIVLLPARLSALLLSAFAVVALALASIGLYGIVSYSVSQRSREVGIRMSLGADGGSVVGMLMQSGLKLVGIGAVLGVVASLAATPALANLLFGVEATDVVSFVVDAADADRRCDARRVRSRAAGESHRPRAGAQGGVAREVASDARVGFDRPLHD